MTAPDPADLFARALEQPPHARRAFLREVCGDDEALLAELLSLLDVHERHPGALTPDAGPLAPETAKAASTPARAPAGASEEEKRPERIGPYTIQSLLGRGGMGHVYEAIDTRGGDRVALKLVPASIDARTPVYRRALEREVRALAALDHPAIAAIRGVEVHDERLMLVMSIAEGRTLADLLDGRALPVERTLRILRRVTLGLEAAHARGLVHLDLKPANVIVHGHCSARVLDFGLARRAFIDAEPRAIDAPRGGGTPGYMSPEQARGTACDHRSDLFSLGCVLFECMSGRRAFAGDSAAAVLAAARDASPPWAMLPAGAPGVTSLIRRCMAKAPGDRPAGAEAVRTALTALIDASGRARAAGGAARGARATGAAGGAAARGARATGATPRGPTASSLPPRPADAFVGQQMWIEHLACLLDDGEPVQLVGTGGCGKTRLALELAHALADGRTEPAWRPECIVFVELAPVTDPDLVPRSVAGALGVRESKETTLTDTIAARLAERRALLVLDNAEHVAGAAASVAGTLRAVCPQLRTLVTTREPLAWEGAVVRVRPLDVPREDASPEEIAASDAVRLLAARARLTAAEAPETLAAICRNVGGIPLGIELAARAAAQLGPDAVASGLDAAGGRVRSGEHDGAASAAQEVPADRTATAAEPTAAPVESPHATLERLLAWSHDRLGDDSARLFRRLAVFRGGFSQEAASAVAAGDGLDDDDVVPALVDLTERFLIEREPGGRAATGTDTLRHRFLEPVRAFAEEMLERSGEASRVRARHRAWFADLCITASPHLRGTAQGKWLARLDGELDNVRAALEAFAASPDDVEEGYRVGAGLGQYWLVRGYFSEGRAHLARLFAHGDDGSRAYVNAVTWDGNFALHLGRLDDAASRYREAVALGQRIGDAEIAARALTNLGVVFILRRELEPARETLVRGLAMQRALGHDADVATTELNLGVVAEWTGDLAEAQRRYEASYVVRRRLDDRAAMASALNNLGAVAEKLDDLATAREHYEAALRIRREVGDRRGTAESLRNVGAVDELGGDGAAALARYEESLELLRDIDDDLGAAETLEALAALLAGDDPERALGHLVESEAIRARTGVPSPPTREQVRRTTERQLVERLGPDALAAARAAAERDR